MIKRLKPSLLVLAFLLCQNVILAQSSPPIIYGQSDDGFPRTIKLVGVVEEISQVPDACGTSRWSGTMKIKLNEGSRKYKREYLYVVAPCSIGRIQDYREFVVEMTVSKLSANSVSKYGNIINTLDSEGLPFYGVLRNRFRILGGP